MNKTIFAALAALTIMTTACNHPQLSTGINTANLDTTIVPQQDFFQFATGGWQAANPIPAEFSRYGTFDALGQQNLEQVNSLIKEIAATTHPQGSIEQKIGDLYNLAMDTARRDNEGIRPLQNTLASIQAIQNRNELSKILGGAMEFGLFALYVDADAMNSSMNILNEYQAGFALGQRDYYVDNDGRTVSIRKAYLKHISNIFGLAGFDHTDEAATTVLRMETRLAKAAKSNVELRDPVANYNKMSVADLQALVPEIDWNVYFAEFGANIDSISIGQTGHLQEVGRMLAEEPLEDLKTLFTWQVLHGATSYLSSDFFAESFDFFGRTLTGRQEPMPLWKRATNIVDGSMGEAVGQMYVKKYFPEKNKQRMVDLVKNLQTALGHRIDALEWMSDTTKMRAHEKLETMLIKVGYPDTWRDYTALDIDPAISYYENLMRSAKFEQDYSLSYLGKPVDRMKWYMTPQTVNAYYNPATNEICFPAGILQYPFFDMSADDAFNYGAIGVVIGHEMTHGFDDQGCQFDKDGNLNNWWTADDKARFDARTDVMRKYFDGIEVAPGLHANGSFTLGENIADHGGLQISFQALSEKMASENADPFASDGDTYTPAQRFFLAYANVWACNIRDEEIVHRTKSDPHSLGRWRVNGALPHIAAWYQAWNVDESSPLYLAPESRVSIW